MLFLSSPSGRDAPFSAPILRHILRFPPLQRFFKGILAIPFCAYGSLSTFDRGTLRFHPPKSKKFFSASEVVFFPQPFLRPSPPLRMARTLFLPKGRHNFSMLAGMF